MHVFSFTFIYTYVIITILFPCFIQLFKNMKIIVWVDMVIENVYNGFKYQIEVL